MLHNTLVRKLVRQLNDANLFTLVPESQKFILVAHPAFRVTPSMVENAIDPDLYDDHVKNITICDNGDGKMDSSKIILV